MGGRAFLAYLGRSHGAFPPIPFPVYNALKDRLLPRVQALYQRAIVPREAPEKLASGDLDILVTGPKTSRRSLGQTCVPHITVQNALGAQHSLQQNTGSRTVHFAVLIQPGEWEAFDLGKEEEEIRQAAGGQDIFYQVDVNTCVDEAEHERIAFFHGYGDLGTIMSVVARNADPALVLGEKGLRLSLAPHPHFELSQSLDDITKFMGWSMDAWEAGFRTKREAFEWIGTSYFFDPQGFRTQGKGISKKRPQRTMYTEFTQWVAEKAGATPKTQQEAHERSIEERQLAFREHVLVYFNKKQEFDAMVRKQNEKTRFKKEVFNSSIVRPWINFGANKDWKTLKLVMDIVREELGGDVGILKLYDELGESALRTFVLGVRERLS